LIIITEQEINPNIELGSIKDEYINEVEQLQKTFCSNLSEKLNLEENEKKDVVIRIDLTLENLDLMGFSYHLGYKSTELIQQMLGQYSSLYTMAIVLKELLSAKGFLDAYHGNCRLILYLI
jgi:hypothetical protein